VRRVLPLAAASLLAALCVAAGGPALGSTPPVLVVSSSGSDGAPCTAAAPCRSLDHAYRAAPAGATVRVLPGTYPAQRITRADKASARRVTVAAAPGGQVRLDSLVVSAQHVAIRGLVVGYWRIDPGAADVAFVGVHTGVFTVRSSSNIAIVGGSVGPWDSNGTAEDPQIGDWDRTLPPPSHILIDGVYFHDITRRANPSAHDDCLQFEAGVDVTIQNSVFTRCGNDADVYIRGDFGPVRDFLIQNNVFGPNESYFSLRLSGQSGPAPPCANILVRNNTALVPMWSDCTAIGSRGVRFVGNVQLTQTNYNCSTSRQVGTVWDYNVYGNGVRCGPHDVVGSLQLRAVGGLQALPGPGSAAVNHGDPASFPRFDIRHHRRPTGRRPDAGAYEVR
jgi:hypothetical protein